MLPCLFILIMIFMTDMAMKNKITRLRCHIFSVSTFRGSKIAPVRSYFPVLQAAGQVKILRFLVNFFPHLCQ